ncbi:hypothetical protein ACPWSR_18345 [Alloiococcus sp. CFN-8]|uniref:hypothetical protein n=1 Tax=Alloiococcus sp. CFN-8 TaxID=3416081 RepID=UPI003CFB2D6E
MKNFKIALMLIFLLFFTGCGISSGIQGDMISTPKNKKITISGTWNITKYKIVNDKLANKAVLDNMIGKAIGFGIERSFFLDEIAASPRYYSRKSSASYFFVNYYNINPRTLNINDYEIDVVTVYSDDKLFIEFIPLDEENGVVYYEGAFLYVERVSTEEPTYVADKDITSKDSSSGILLALGSDQGFARYQEQDVNQSPYRTLWLSWDNDGLKDIYQIEDILLPRSREFWSIGVNRSLDNGSTWERINAVKLEEENISIDNKAIEKATSSHDRYVNINFVGIDYMTIEVLEEHSSGLYSKKLKALHIDNINKSEGAKLEGVKLSDIIGKVGKTTIEQSAQATLNTINSDDRDKFESSPREDSFSVTRRNGHWIMIGRLNSLIEGYEDKYLDFNINILPTSKLVGEDRLFLSWNKVKEQLPKAIDIYTSPNQDIAIVITEEELLIYRINNGGIIDIPLFSFKLNPTEKVVMAQWATGSQVEKWDEIVKELGEEIKEN